MRYLELLQLEHQSRQFKLATPKPAVSVRYYDPDILKINNVIDKVSRYYGYSIRQLRERNLNRYRVHARYMIFYICVHLYGLPVVKVAKSVGKRDRTTVILGRDVIHARLQSEPALAADLRDIRGMM